MRCNRLGLLLLLCLALSALVHGQDYDDENDDDSVPGTAGLSLELNPQGGAKADFYLPEAPKNWDELRPSLAATLHCPEQHFRAPELSSRTAQRISRWPAARRESYLKYFEQAKRKELTAECGSVLSWNGFTHEGSFDLSDLATKLKQSGMQQLWFSISFPRAKSVEYSKENLSYVPRGETQFVSYQIGLTGETTPSPVHIAFGLSRRTIYRSVAIAIGFIFLPLTITLYMRQAALASGKIDPIAAWFSYFKTINWCINGSLLLWITSGLGARQVLQDWVASAASPGWAATLLDALIVIGPAFLVYFACVAVSYPLHVYLRGTTWTRREFLLEQLVNVGAQALPLMFFLAAIANLTKSGNAAGTFFLFALISWMVFRTLKMRVSKSYPHSLTRGELRDKVFELAKKAGVRIQQIFVLPTGKSQIANAFAAGNGTVMFTDYLLQHLTKREVEGVAAHEIAHLQLGHVKKRSLTLLGALMLPPTLSGVLQGVFDVRRLPQSIHVGLAGRVYWFIAWFWAWSQRDFLLILAGFGAFYFVSRRFEHAADIRGAELTEDAEAQISGLLKLSRLNLMPIQWGKGTGTWLTHPSMVRRAERIAASSGMSAEQLQAIIGRYQMELKSGTHAQLTSGDHYAVPEATDPENLSSAAKRQQTHQFRLWSSLLAHVIPPAAFVLLIQAKRLDGNAALLVYLLGAIVTPILSIMYSAWLGVFGRRQQRIRLAARLEREGAPPSEKAIVVGFSPGAVVRFYAAHYFNWDIGFLELCSDRLLYRGEQVEFALAPERIDSVCIGQGGPSWWSFPRVYVRWQGADGKPAVFSVASLEPGSIQGLRRQAEALRDRIDRLQLSPASGANMNTPDLPPSIGEITSRSPSELGGLKTNLTVMICLLPLAVAINALLRTDSLWYIFAVVLFTRLIESIPYWRFHDQILDFRNRQREAAAAATASEN
jgi:Zn-dependent protease with chaperone function